MVRVAALALAAVSCLFVGGRRAARSKCPPKPPHSTLPVAVPLQKRRDKSGIGEYRPQFKHYARCQI